MAAAVVVAARVGGAPVAEEAPHSASDPKEWSVTQVFAVDPTDPQRVVGRWGLVPQWGRTAALQCEAGAVGDAAELVRRLEAAATVLDRDLVARVPVNSADLCAAMAAAGWRGGGGRVDWTWSVERLPHEPARPDLQWKSLGRAGLEAAAQILRAAVPFDPLGPRTGTPREWMRAWMDDPSLQGGLQVGFVADVPAVLTGVQVNPSTGWGRVPYMAVAPSMWGNGLGTAAMLRAFVLLRARGATTWNGGCAEENQRFLRVVERWGVVPALHSQEWIFFPCSGSSS